MIRQLSYQRWNGVLDHFCQFRLARGEGHRGRGLEMPGAGMGCKHYPVPVMALQTGLLSAKEMHDLEEE